MGKAIEKDRTLAPPREIDVLAIDGTPIRKTTLISEVFGVKPNVPVMHQVVNAQLAAARSGTQSTKTRAEVSGGGSKPWRQKGTGRARQGSIRAPHFSGGGVALGPKPRDYSQKTPKKMVQLALRSALSDRAAEDKIRVVEWTGFEAPKTKDAQAFLNACNVDGNVLVVLADEEIHENVFLSFRNLQNVHVVHEAELNTFDVLRHDYLILAAPDVEDEAVSVAAPMRKQSATVETEEVAE